MSRKKILVQHIDTTIIYQVIRIDLAKKNVCLCVAPEGAEICKCLMS